MDEHRRKLTPEDFAINADIVRDAGKKVAGWREIPQRDISEIKGMFSRLPDRDVTVFIKMLDLIPVIDALLGELYDLGHSDDPELRKQAVTALITISRIMLKAAFQHIPQEFRDRLYADEIAWMAKNEGGKAK